jgi:hypothetical protein
MLVTCLAVAAFAVAAGSAAAYPLRNPQVVFNSAGVQARLSTQDSGIQANTDQLELQVISFTFVGNILNVYLLASSDAEFGLYAPSQAGEPTHYPLFASGAGAWSYSTFTRTRDGQLVVTRFDSLGVYLGRSIATWPGGAEFGFYVSGPGGTWYSQDDRNSGHPHALTYAGTGVNAGGLFECLEPGPFDPGEPEAFTGLMVFVEPSTCGTASLRGLAAYGTDCSPTVSSTWGSLKVRYR